MKILGDKYLSQCNSIKRIHIEIGDITTYQCEAIVNAANTTLLGGGGVDGAIHQQAGPDLLDECKKLGGCVVGEAKITNGYKLKAKYVIHTVGPIWYGGKKGESNLLSKCYYNSLELAVKNNITSIAFPCISTGAYGFPLDKACEIAFNTTVEFLKDYKVITDVYFVCFDEDNFSYYNDLYIKKHLENLEIFIKNNYTRFYRRKTRYDFEESNCLMANVSTSIDDYIEKNATDDTFTKTLFEMIDERDLSDPEVYNKVYISRQHFSKLRSNPRYLPTKQTVLKLILALELNELDARVLLESAGYAFRKSDLTDVIISYCIQEKIYNIDAVNEFLYNYQENCL